MDCLLKETDDDYFWCKKENYIFKDEKSFNQFILKIKESFKNLNLSYSTENSYAVAYVISFGTFVSMFKYTKPDIKKKFIKMYSKKLGQKENFDLLYKYLLSIRTIRNRCAHGSHIVSNSFVNQLNQFNAIKKEENTKSGRSGYSVFELVLVYLIDNTYCKEEFKNNLIKILSKYEPVYKKYGGKQSINPSIIERLKRK